MAGSELKILVIGGGGQLGWELQRALCPLGDLIVPDRSELDLARPSSIGEVVRDVSPDLIVNAAAFTDVDAAENHPELARAVNAEGPRHLAESARDRGAVLVHYSTDYVFDGEQDVPYREHDEPRPLNVYGQTKLEGERAIIEVGPTHFILRTSWLYEYRRKNFLMTMLRLLREKRSLAVVRDQVGTPTRCRTVAEATAHLIMAAGIRDGGVDQPLATLGGTYHLVARGEVSRYQQACAILEDARDLWPEGRFETREIRPIPSEEYLQEADRPGYSVLSPDRVNDTFALRLPVWRRDLRRCLEDLHAVSSR